MDPKSNYMHVIESSIALMEPHLLNPCIIMMPLLYAYATITHTHAHNYVDTYSVYLSNVSLTISKLVCVWEGYCDPVVFARVVYEHRIHVHYLRVLRYAHTHTEIDTLCFPHYEHIVMWDIHERTYCDPVFLLPHYKCIAT